MRTERIKTKNGLFTVTIRDDADESVVNEIFRFHEYRHAESLIAAATNPVLDVGAHAGFFSLWVRGLNSTVPVLAVEPAPENLLALHETIVRNKLSNISIIPGALAGEHGERRLVLSADSHNHALAPAHANDDGVVVAAHTLLGIAETFKVQRFALVKLDIEGGEIELFDTWSEKDYAKIGALMVEYHAAVGADPKQITDTLRQAGFGVQHFPSKFDKTMGFLWAVNKR